MDYTNEMQLEFDSRSQNESFARVCVAAFITQLDPTIEEITEIKTAVSEAVTNAIIHGYENRIEKVYIHCIITDKLIEIEVMDKGVGIENIEEAKEPLYTSKPELERSGMGFTFMESFMDEVEIISEPGQGTRVRMKKTISGIDREK